MLRKNFLLIVIALLYITSHLIYTQVNHRSLNGPWRVNDGRDIAFGISGNTPILYAADSASSLMISTNGGESWTLTGTQILNPLTVICEPNNPQNLIVGAIVGNIGVVRKSTNFGNDFISPYPISEMHFKPYKFGMSPAEPNYVFLGALWNGLGSTLRKSYFGGTNFQSDPYFFHTVQTHLLAIAWHPTDPNRVWVGGSAVRVVSANEPPPEQEETFITEGMPEPQALDKGLWYSSNAGYSWTKIQNLDKNVSAIAVSVAGNTTTIWVGTAEISSSGCQLYKSTNNGQSWNTVKTLYKGSITHIAVNSSNNRIYFTNNRLGVYVSYDNGLTWYDGATNQTLGDWDARSIALHSSAPNLAYVVTSTSIFKGERANPGEIQWQSINNGINKVNVTSSASSYNNVFSVSSTMPGTMRYLPTVGWKTYYYFRGSQDHEQFSPRSINFHSSNLSIAYATGKLPTEKRAAIFRSTDQGNTWNEVHRSSSINTRYELYGTVVDPKSPQRVYAYGLTRHTNGVQEIISNFLLSISNGENWIAMPKINDDYPCITMAIDKSGPNNFSEIFYAGLIDKGLWKSTDAGANWSQWSIGNTTVYSIALKEDYPQTIYAGGNPKNGYGMWKSTNSGASWIPILSRTDTVKKIVFHPSYPTSVNRLFVISRRAGAVRDSVFETKDGGTTWRNVTANLPLFINDFKLEFPIDSTIVVSTNEGTYIFNPPPDAPIGITKSVENNHPKISWSANQETDIKEYQVYRFFRTSCEFMPPSKWHCTNPTNPELIHTTTNTYYVDNTQTIFSGPPQPGVDVKQACYFVKAVDKSNFVSENSATADFLVGTIQQEQKIAVNEPKPEKFKLHNNYPNPFNSTTVIKYDLPEDVYVTIKIYNLLGCLTDVIVDEFQTAGYKSVEFSSDKLPSGIYIYKINAGSFTVAKKMLLIR